MNIFQTILDWSEAWAVMIPLTAMLIYRNTLAYMKPVRIFIGALFVINICILVLWKYQDYMPYQWMKSNNFLYNLVSILRFFIFTWFFILLQQPYFKWLKRVIPILFGLFVLINFICWEDFFYYWSFSSRLLSLETGLLLLYCLQYYFYILNEETEETRRPPSFWVVTGLSIYVVINFPILLFYKAFLKEFENFAVSIWDITNISFILFCILLTKAIYDARH